MVDTEKLITEIKAQNVEVISALTKMTAQLDKFLSQRERDEKFQSAVVKFLGAIFRETRAGVYFSPYFSEEQANALFAKMPVRKTENV